MKFLKQGVLDDSPFYYYLIGILVVSVGFSFGRVFLDGVIFFQMTRHQDITDETINLFNKNPDFDLIYLNSSLGLLLMILTFVVGLLALWLWYKKVHKQSLISLFNRFKHIDYNRALFGLGLWMVFILLMELVNFMINPSAFTLKFDLIKFLYLLPVAFLLIPIQSSTEELIFRAYLPQGLAKLIKIPAIIILICSALFAAIHLGNPEVAKLGVIPMMSYYFVAGLFLAVVTIMDDRLELALGIHAAVNIFGTVVVSYQDSALQTDSIFSTLSPNPWIAIFSLLICASIYVFICSKKYNWPSLGILFKNIDSFSNET